MMVTKKKKILWRKVSPAVTHPWLPDSKFLMGYFPYLILISVHQEVLYQSFCTTCRFRNCANYVLKDIPFVTLSEEDWELPEAKEIWMRFSQFLRSATSPCMMKDYTEWVPHLSDNPTFEASIRVDLATFQ